jgi:hypothetical protein
MPALNSPLFLGAFRGLKIKKTKKDLYKNKNRFYKEP